MLSYRTIVGELLRLTGKQRVDQAFDVYEAALKMTPAAETVSDDAAIKLQVDDHALAWATAMAFESLRGWSWPYWMNVKTNPTSVTHVPLGSGLLLKNQVARDAMPLLSGAGGGFAGTVDRRGMFTPPDGRFSVEVWFRLGDKVIRPADVLDERQVSFDCGGGGEVFVRLQVDGAELVIRATSASYDDFESVKLAASLHVTGRAGVTSAAVYFAIRPYTLEGIAPVSDLVYNSKGFWMSDGRVVAMFTRKPEICWASNARHGDSGLFLAVPPERTAVRCRAGMATAVSSFHSEPEIKDADVAAEMVVPLRPAFPRELPFAYLMPRSPGTGRKSTVVESYQQADAAQRNGGLPGASLIQLLAATDVSVPAMQRLFVRKNNWIVPAVRALLVSGEMEAAFRLVSFAILGIQPNGYMPNAHGRWAFQGQVLVAAADFGRLAGRKAGGRSIAYPQIRAVAGWIMRKRREISHAPNKPAGLFPPGFSAVGGGPEYNFVDNLWAVEGLMAAVWLARLHDQHSDAEAFYEDAVKLASRLKSAIHRELEYSVLQQVPGRFQRSFDAAGAADILDLVLADESKALLRPLDWFGQLVDALSAPLGYGDNDLLAMDARGVIPARRLLLYQAQREQGISGADGLDLLASRMVTIQSAWPDMIHPGVKSGLGQLAFDPEAASLYLLLRRKLDDDGQ